MGLAKLADFVLSHKRYVVAIWLVLAIAAGVAAPSAIKAFTQDFNVPGREGAETNNELLVRYGNGGNIAPAVVVVQLPEGRGVDDPATQAELQAFDQQLRSIAPSARIASFASTGDRGFVSADGLTTFTLIFSPPGVGFGDSPELIAVREWVPTATVAGAPAMLTGYAELESGGAGGGSSNVLIEVAIGSLGALVVLLWVFASALAIVPLIMGGVSILVTFLVIYGLTTVTEVSFIVEFIVALIGLGIAIDYALLIVTRWREELQNGLSNEQAVRRAVVTAGHSVLFSGLTVGVGLVSLIVLPVPFLRSIGLAGLLIPIVSIAAALTLLPVILATAGPKLDKWSLRKGSQESGFWTRWTRLVVKRRIPAALIGFALLGALVIPALGINIGDPRIQALANGGAAVDGLNALNDSGIGEGVLLPFEILVQDGNGAAVADAIRATEGLTGAVAPSTPDWNVDGSAVVLALPAADPNDGSAEAVLSGIRSAIAGASLPATVGGVPAQNVDFNDAVYGNFGLLLVMVSVLTFVLLVRAFGSVVVPLKALLLNFVSIGAAYGVLVLVWQKGYGAELIWGYNATDAISAWIPLVVFAFLFGLSMDYEVFILDRVREEYEATGSTDEALVRGIGMTGRLVTSAALILFFAFGALASAPVVPVKILATGLAAGILLDATVVRSLLVPATVSLMGRWNWWMPSFLSRRIGRREAAPALGD